MEFFGTMYYDWVLHVIDGKLRTGIIVAVFGKMGMLNNANNADACVGESFLGVHRSYLFTILSSSARALTYLQISIMLEPIISVVGKVE